jgi:hypothetical protein
VVGGEQWAEVRRLHFVRGLSIREIHRRTGLHRGHDPPRAGRCGAAALSTRCGRFEARSVQGGDVFGQTWRPSCCMVRLVVGAERAVLSPLLSPSPANAALEPKHRGIIIRVSGVRVPPPASRCTAVFRASAGFSRGGTAAFVAIVLLTDVLSGCDVACADPYLIVAALVMAPPASRTTSAPRPGWQVR